VVQPRGRTAAASAWPERIGRGEHDGHVTHADFLITNFLIIGSFELLQIFRKCWKLQLAGLNETDRNPSLLVVVLKHAPETGAPSAQGAYDAGCLHTEPQTW